MADDVGGQVLPVGVAHDLANQGAGLNEVVVLGVPVVGVPSEFARIHGPVDLPGPLRIGDRASVGIRSVNRLVAGVAIGHGALFVVGVHLDLGGVDRQLLVVGAYPVEMGVVVREDPAHQNFVRAQAAARAGVAGRECRLLHLGGE